MLVMEAADGKGSPATPPPTETAVHVGRGALPPALPVSAADASRDLWLFAVRFRVCDRRSTSLAPTCWVVVSGDKDLARCPW